MSEKDKKFGEVSDEDLKLASEAAPEDLQQQESVSLADEVLDWFESFVFALFIVILIFIFFFRIVLVDGESMNNTLNDGDRLIMTHINYTPEKDDIVVVNSYTLNKTIIKRVIGTAGDKVRVDYNQNTVYVNDKAISNDNIKEPMVNTRRFDDEYMVAEGEYEYVVPDGSIFVMGDNRNNSTDSRMLGFISTDDVLGHAVVRLFPFGDFGKIS